MPGASTRHLARVALALTVAATLTLSSRPSAAQSTETSATRLPRAPMGSWQLLVDNDLFAIRGVARPPDYDFTSGVAVAFTAADAPRWLRTLGRDDETPRAGCRYVDARERDAIDAAALSSDCIATAVGAHQDIFTPQENVPEPVPGARPYAAWMYASGDVHLRRQRGAHTRVRSLSLDAGVIGPMALGETMQNGIHRLWHARRWQGWAHQLTNAAGAQLRVGESHRWLLGNPQARWVVPAVSAGAFAETGSLRSRIGAGVNVAFGLLDLVSWQASDPLASRPRRVRLDAGYRRELVLHDAFIEGRAGIAGAQRRPSVGQFETGLALRLQRFTLSYRFVSRQREYDGGRTSHPWGALSIAVQQF